MKGNIDDTSITNLDNFMLNLKSYYPELYNHVFVEAKMASVLKNHWALMNFAEKINIPKGFTYNKIWHHIINNEDKHDWWML